jgi:hypothetical protein
MTRAKDISKIVTDADLSGTLDVTGDLTVDTSTLKVDSTNNRVGVGTSPSHQLHVKSSGNGKVRFEGNANTDLSDLLISHSTSGDSGLQFNSNQLNIFTYGAITFNAGTGNISGGYPANERMRILSDGKIGLSSSTVSVDSQVAIGGGNLELTTAGAKYWIPRASDGVLTGSLYSPSGSAIRLSGAGTGSGSLEFEPSSSSGVALTINSSGNVGIGTTTALSGSSSVTALRIGNQINIYEYDDGGNPVQMNINQNIDASENYIVSDHAARYQMRDGVHKWFSVASGTAGTASGIGSGEKMRIDSSGNLLVGKTSVGVGNLGIELRNNNLFAATRANDPSIYGNRTGTDGDIIELRKDNSTIGKIGSVFTSSASRLFISNSNTGVHFNDATKQIIPCNSTGAKQDNSIDLGNLTGRYDDVYATNGTINTSDRNEKQDIEELNEAEQRVAVACKGLLRKYRWKDKVAEKGDNARIHFGIIAQDLQDAFTAEGLDAGDYAMFCSDTWWELDGETYETEEEAPEGATEKTRLGVRYNQLLAFIISAI